MGDAFALHRHFFDIDNDKLVEAQKTTYHEIKALHRLLFLLSQTPDCLGIKPAIFGA